MLEFGKNAMKIKPLVVIIFMKLHYSSIISCYNDCWIFQNLKKLFKIFFNSINRSYTKSARIYNKMQEPIRNLASFF